MIKSFYDPELGSRLILTDQIEELRTRGSDDYFKILWNRGASFSLEMDSLNIKLQENDLISLTPLQEPELSNISGDYFMLLFNREFYCIHENDEEVSCEGLLFWGYTKQQALEVNLIVALKTISNYTNHLADTPLDEAFQPEKLEFATA